MEFPGTGGHSQAARLSALLGTSTLPSAPVHGSRVRETVTSSSPPPQGTAVHVSEPYPRHKRGCPHSWWGGTSRSWGSLRIFPAGSSPVHWQEGCLELARPVMEGEAIVWPRQTYCHGLGHSSVINILSWSRQPPNSCVHSGAG